MLLAKFDKLRQARKIVLPIGVDLQRMSKAGLAREREALHHCGAFAAIAIEPIHDHSILGGVKCGQRGARGFVASVVYDKNRKIDIAQALDQLANHIAMIETRNYGATLESH
jgi:hypothetical protein